MYYNTKNHGLPFSGGWAEQPYYVIDAMNILDNESIKIKNKEVENNKGKEEPKERKTIGGN